MRDDARFTPFEVSGLNNWRTTGWCVQQRCDRCCHFLPQPVTSYRSTRGERRVAVPGMRRRDRR